MIKTITIEREYGTGAPNISQTIARSLGWKLWDDEITHEIARRLKCKPELVGQREERLDSVFSRLVQVFMRGSFESRVEMSGLELLNAETLSALFEKIIPELADQGPCVLVGRGAPYFLRERQDAFHVFLYAPYGEKMRRLTAASGNRNEAARLLETVDSERAAFVRKYYGKEWPDRYLYNLMLNVKAGDDAVIEMILNEVHRLNGTAAHHGTPE